MAKRAKPRARNWARWYDEHGVLGQLAEKPVEIALEEELRSSVLAGERARRLENVSIKLDRAHILALRKIATSKAIPYQSLIRHLIALGIKRELKLAG